MFPETLTINTMSQTELLTALHREHVGLNVHAQQLLTMDNLQPASAPVRTLHLALVRVADLNLHAPATLPTIFAAASVHGLTLCPPITGAYLRLVYRDQSDGGAPLHAGRAPLGSLTVAAPPQSTHPQSPKGFYLRMLNGQPWLRGYRCDDDYVWHHEDTFVFCSSRG